MGNDQTLTKIRKQEYTQKIKEASEYLEKKFGPYPGSLEISTQGIVTLVIGSEGYIGMTQISEYLKSLFDTPIKNYSPIGPKWFRGRALEETDRIDTTTRAQVKTFIVLLEKNAEIAEVECERFGLRGRYQLPDGFWSTLK